MSPAATRCWLIEHAEVRFGLDDGRQVERRQGRQGRSGQRDDHEAGEQGCGKASDGGGHEWMVAAARSGRYGLWVTIALVPWYRYRGARMGPGTPERPPADAGTSVMDDA